MDSPTQILIEQLQTLLIVLERTIVQRQLIALLLVFLAAELLSFGLRRFMRTRRSGSKPIPLPRRISKLNWAGLFNTMLAPVAMLVLGYLTILLFSSQGYPAQLLRNAMGLVWLWLGYSLLLALLYALFGPGVRPYHRRLLLPLFVGVIGLRILDNFIDLRVIANILLFRLFGADITLGTLLGAFLAFYVFLMLAWIVQEALHTTLPRRTDADPGVIYSISTITRYAVIAIGILATLRVLGVDLTTLTVIGGGLSIGIGIGLQRVVANFISGIILLFEQSLRPGDVIDLEGQLGTVEKLNIRSTVVRTINNVELIVPNETFVTTQVTTYTKSNNKIRIMLPLGVSYDSDPKEVRQLVTETAVKHGLVLKEPEPTLLFRAFGDSSLNFDLAVWIDQPDRMNRVRSDLYYMIWETLTKNEIEIPFPQRDLNLRRGWEQVTAGDSRGAPQPRGQAQEPAEPEAEPESNERS